MKRRRCAYCLKVKDKLHRFPADIMQANRWAEVLDWKEEYIRLLKTDIVPRSIVICSDHFHDSSYKNSDKINGSLRIGQLPFRDDSITERRRLAKQQHIYNQMAEMIGSDPQKFVAVSEKEILDYFGPDKSLTIADAIKEKCLSEGSVKIEDVSQLLENPLFPPPDNSLVAESIKLEDSPGKVSIDDVPIEQFQDAMMPAMDDYPIFYKSLDLSNISKCHYCGQYAKIHRFPTDPDLANKWAEVLDWVEPYKELQQKYKNHRSIKLCVDHFAETSYTRNDKANGILRRNQLPIKSSTACLKISKIEGSTLDSSEPVEEDTKINIIQLLNQPKAVVDISVTVT